MSSTENCVFHKFGGKETERTLFISCRKNKYISSAVKAFIEAVLKIYKKDGN